MSEGKRYLHCAVCGNEIHDLPPVLEDVAGYCWDHRPPGCPGDSKHDHGACLLRARADDLERLSSSRSK